MLPKNQFMFGFGLYVKKCGDCPIIPQVAEKLREQQDTQCPETLGVKSRMSRSNKMSSQPELLILLGFSQFHG